MPRSCRPNSPQIAQSASATRRNRYRDRRPGRRPTARSSASRDRDRTAVGPRAPDEFRNTIRREISCHQQGSCEQDADRATGEQSRRTIGHTESARLDESNDRPPYTEKFVKKATSIIEALIDTQTAAATMAVPRTRSRFEGDIVKSTPCSKSGSTGNG
jgi:hypothetical protein